MLSHNPQSKMLINVNQVLSTKHSELVYVTPSQKSHHNYMYDIPKYDCPEYNMVPAEMWIH